MEKLVFNPYLQRPCENVTPTIKKCDTDNKTSQGHQFSKMWRHM